MTRFVEIKRPKTRLVDGVEVVVSLPTNEEVQARFAKIVEETPGLHPWSHSAAKDSEGTHLVIGVVTWSGYDLRALDELAVVAANMEMHGFRIEVFDIDRVFNEEGREAFEERIPGIGDFQVMPILGVWENGIQVKTAVGHWARKILTEYVQQNTRGDAE